MVQVAGNEARAQGGAGPVIEAVELSKRYGDLEAVRGVSFAVSPGETYGFLGPNGAGKSTTISMLCTLIQPSSGSASVAGFDVLVDGQIAGWLDAGPCDPAVSGCDMSRFLAPIRPALGPRPVWGAMQEKSSGEAFRKAFLHQQRR